MDQMRSRYLKKDAVKVSVRPLEEVMEFLPLPPAMDVTLDNLFMVYDIVGQSEKVQYQLADTVIPTPLGHTQTSFNKLLCPGASAHLGSKIT